MMNPRDRLQSARLALSSKMTIASSNIRLSFHHAIHKPTQVVDDFCGPPDNRFIEPKTAAIAGFSAALALGIVATGAVYGAKKVANHLRKQ